MAEKRNGTLILVELPCYNGRHPKEWGLEVPIIRIDMWPGRTHAQKAELARAITDAMVRIANTTPEDTIIVFEDIARENWAQSGALASDL